MNGYRKHATNEIWVFRLLSIAVTKIILHYIWYEYIYNNKITTAIFIYLYTLHASIEAVGTIFIKLTSIWVMYAFELIIAWITFNMTFWLSYYVLYLLVSIYHNNNSRICNITIYCGLFQGYREKAMFVKHYPTKNGIFIYMLHNTYCFGFLSLLVFF